MNIKQTYSSLLLIGSLTLIACNDTKIEISNHDSEQPDPPVEVPPQNPAIEHAVRLNNDSCVPPAAVVTTGSPTKTKAFPNLPAIPNVLAMVQPQNDNSYWLLLNRSGKVFHIENNYNVTQFNQVLDIGSKVSTNGEMGMTGIAFHPNFGQAENRVFILYNDINNQGRSTLSSFNFDTTNWQINANSEKVILTLDQPIPFHNGGDIAFGNDGMLYASFGDSEMDFHSQNLHNLYGSLIRIDVDTYPYTIPNDNPFNTGQAICQHFEDTRTSDCPEVFAYGFRNPWRFSIDSQTGIPWVGDVGDSRYEEIDRIISGGNYGWPIMEGAHCIQANCDQSAYQLPISDYGRDSGVSVVGGYVYRGTESPSLFGQYIFGDIYSGNFWQVAADALVGTDESSLISSHGIAAMAQGNNGEVYQLQFFSDDETETGINVYKISGGGGVNATMPDKLSDTGCFDPINKSSAQGVFEYSINNSLWSDGALKQRAFAIPNNTKIDVQLDGDFLFPENSILIKHFLDGDTFLETRLLVNHSTGWQGYSYEWNSEQTEANLLSSGKTTKRDGFTHTFPSQNQCGSCHTNAANFSLGVEVSQLNKQDPNINANQVDYLTSAGYFSQPIWSSESDKLFALDDSSVSLEDRAKSYLHSNCSGCHRPGTTNRSTMDLRMSTPLNNMNVCESDPILTNLGDDSAKLIKLGDADSSVLLMRMKSNDQNLTMPPIARLKEDTAATQLISEWINTLQTCD
ncbi:PQQ-dependent sugar dehydrogenase [Catenovulum maritimum]|uniref:Glucose/Sorbosone dehydrogenase domain-containing protein n=1 Tax=Catenovulum maritimum TaxID=1513271 RepID=A0A0J8GVN5_9ALTE|nr:PQQ-dependent sugar dehydrogenase [Catenovulum maritimum]KMT66807.1 hypothetical protein XM47_01425 [Catenovulum maritimum]